MGREGRREWGEGGNFGFMYRWREVTAYLVHMDAKKEVSQFPSVARQQRKNWNMWSEKKRLATSKHITHPLSRPSPPLMDITGRHGRNKGHGFADSLSKLRAYPF